MRELTIVVVSLVCGVLVALAYRGLRRRWQRLTKNSLWGRQPLDPPEVGEEWFKRAKLSKPPHGKPVRNPHVQHSEPEGTPVSETPDGKLWLVIARGHCPHCNQDTQFIEGPSGGMSTNIQCETCGWWYNVTPAIGIAQDIGFKDREVH
jgi:hypothetical protein